MPAEADDAKTVAVERTRDRSDLDDAEPVGIDVLDLTFHRADLDALEPDLGEPAERLVERERLEADRRGCSRRRHRRDPVYAGGS